MLDQLPVAGGASADLQPSVHEVWTTIAAQNGVDLTGFDVAAPLAERHIWALSRQLQIGAVLSRFSTQLQQSTSAQVLDCVRFAAANKIYVPPELVCVDEGVSGRKVRRDGLDRVKAILRKKIANVLLVFKVSRLFRVAYRGFQFFQEEVVEEGLRAISVSQGIDTNDGKTWKQLAYLHGIMDEMLLTAIADHVRSGITNLFQSGFVTGALTLGYAGVEVPGAPLTKMGRPRRIPKIEEKTAALIHQHFEWIREGLPIRKGWQRWVKAGGPCDPRSTVRRMSPTAYRRLLSNPRYTGCWAFGRKRNAWSSKRDYTRQIEQPETEVRVIQSEELRIVSDELFHAVQARLAKNKTGPRGPNRRKEPRLCDLVTDCFVCAACSTPENPVRYYQGGANGHGMRCKRGELCPNLTVVNREFAIRAVCEQLQDSLAQDAELIERTVVAAQAVDARGNGDIRDQLAVLEKQLAKFSNKIGDLTELMGDGSEEDRDQLKASLRKAMGDRATLLAEQAGLKRALSASAATLTPERVKAILADLSGLLENGASGKLGEDAVYKAAEVFRLLVGGRILVQVERRPNRKRVNVSATLTPQTLAATKSLLDDPRPAERIPAAEVRIWLRQRPKRDILAERVHVLIDEQGMSYRAAAKALQAEGNTINSGIVWQIYRRYYEMIGLPVPEVRYNNGHSRKPRGVSVS